MASKYVVKLMAAGMAITAVVCNAYAQTGVTPNTILVGQSAGLTGGQADYSKDIQTGIEAYFASVNRLGGVNGRQIKLVSVDDQGKKDAVLANTKKLVEEQKVFSLIGYTSGAGVEITLNYLLEAKVPMLSPATGNMGIREKFNPYLFHTRAGYGDEMKKVISDMTLLGYKRFALAYLDDVGPANLKSMQDALAANKLTAVSTVGLNRNSDDFSAQIKTFLDAKPDYVVFISNGKPIIKIVQGMKKAGYKGQFVTSSFSGTRVVTDLKEDAPGLVMAQVLPQPKKDTLPIIKEFRKDLTQAGTKAEPNYTILEGYIAARVMVEGFRRAGPALSREKFIAALEKIRDLDLGGYRITFSDKDHDGSHYVDIGIVGSGGKLKF
jgi:branched-chain amino acid transport system substrate-binding protein